MIDTDTDTTTDTDTDTDTVITKLGSDITELDHAISKLDHTLTKLSHAVLKLDSDKFTQPLRCSMMIFGLFSMVFALISRLGSIKKKRKKTFQKLAVHSLSFLQIK